MTSEELFRGLASGIPHRPSLDDLRREFVDHGLDAWLMRWVVRALLASAYVHLRSRYNCETYSPTGAWDDDGIQELVYDCLVEKCIEGKAVEAALQRANSVRGAIRYLETSLRNYMISERRRDVGSNIFERIVEVLEQHPGLRVLAGLGAQGAYGLHVWHSEPPPVIDDAEIRDALRWFPHDVQWVEYHTGDRRSPGILSKDLARIAYALVEKTEKLWTAGQVKAVLEMRFNLNEGFRDDSPSAIEELTRVPANTASVLQDVVAADLAEKAVGSLTGRQRKVLAVLVDDPKAGVREIAARLNISKSSVSTDRQRIQDVFSGLPLDSAEERLQVTEAVKSLLSTELVVTEHRRQVQVRRGSP